MDSRKKIIGIITLSLCISISLGMAAGNTWAAAKPVEISVIGGNEGRGGKYKGYFEATYAGKKIKVIYSYKANRANPMEHPIKVYQGDKKIADWKCYLQQGNNQQLAIKDREISLIGKWQDQKTFEAYKIYLPADIRKIGEK